MDLSVPNHPGWVRFCREGALLEPSEKTGLGISCLALKTCVMLGLVARLLQGELEGWVNHIQSFQTEKGRFVSFFEDPAVLRVTDKRAGWFRRDILTRRAETRQACATLLSVGSVPLQPIAQLPRMSHQVRRYIQGLDWTEPWGAGSHVGHLLFFYELNARVFGETATADELLPVVISELDRLQDPESGSWYSRRPAPHQVVNGAMKVLTGYAFLNKPFRYPERLIDTCLAVANDDDGCNNADVIYVLHQCSHHTTHRREEILDYCIRRLKTVERFRREDGAFSFYGDRAQTNYYGASVSRGLRESDVHGTTLFVWTLVMIGDLLGFNQEMGWKLPVT
jgi:hypothetical protein